MAYPKLIISMKNGLNKLAKGIFAIFAINIFLVSIAF